MGLRGCKLHDPGSLTSWLPAGYGKWDSEDRRKGDTSRSSSARCWRLPDSSRPARLWTTAARADAETSRGSSSDRSGMSSADPGPAGPRKCSSSYMLVGSSLKEHQQLATPSLIPPFLFVPPAPNLICALPHLPTPV